MGHATRQTTLVGALPFLTVLIVLQVLCSASAQQFQELYAFTGPPDGSVPKGALIQGRDGCLYGTTSNGGSVTDNGNRPWGLGTVFKMSPDGRLTVLASFGGTNGMYPLGALLEASDG